VQRPLKRTLYTSFQFIAAQPHTPASGLHSATRVLGDYGHSIPNEIHVQFPKP